MMGNLDDLHEADDGFQALMRDMAEAGGSEDGGAAPLKPIYDGMTDADKARLRKKYPSLAHGR